MAIKLLSNRPYGVDLYKGKSQQKLAKTISNFIKDTDKGKNNVFAEYKGIETPAEPRVIGLEGGWGVGKSNVIQLLDKELGDSYYIFEFDAWGYQEDLQRRAFLEAFTTELVIEDVLQGDTTISLRGNDEKIKTNWKEKSRYLLAKKTEKDELTFPTLNDGAITALLALILVPIASFMSTLISLQRETWVNWHWSLQCLVIIIMLGLPLVPIIIALERWRRWCKANPHKSENKKQALSYFLAIYKDKVESRKTYTAISEDEPSIPEFREWMNDISNNLAKSYCKESNNENSDKVEKVIIVFDNMDRLPSDKVKTLWSLINTFFADGSFKNIWAMVTYDRDNISNAFALDSSKQGSSGKESAGRKSCITNHFINKSFPIQFKVPVPIIEDYKYVFSEFFKKAFTNEDFNKDAEEKINRIFRKTYPHATTREIIIFINDLVMLKRTWGDEIQLVSMAVFSALKNKINAEEINYEIIRGEKFKEKSLNKIIDYDTKLQGELSALYYGVPVKDAKQIPTRQTMLNQINKGEPSQSLIKDITDNEYGLSILKELIDDIEPEDVSNYIISLQDLTLVEDSEQNSIIKKCWSHLHANYKSDKELTNLSEEHKVLLKNVSEEEKQTIINDVYKKYMSNSAISGEALFNAFYELENKITDLESDIELTIPYQEHIIDPEKLIPYIKALEGTEETSSAIDIYSKYKVSSDPNLTDTHFTALIVMSLQDESKEYFLTELKDAIMLYNIDNSFRLPETCELLSNLFSEGKKLNKNNIVDITKTITTLSQAKPIFPLPSASNATALYNSINAVDIEKNKNYPATLALYMVLNPSSQSPSINIEENGHLLESVLEFLSYYISEEEFLVKHIDKRDDTRKIIINEIISQNKSETKLNNINFLISKFENICTQFDVNKETLLAYIDKKWDPTESGQSVLLSSDETADEKLLIAQNIDFSFYTACESSELNIAQHINSTVVELIKTVPVKTLADKYSETDTYFWYKIIDLHFANFEHFSDNLNELAKVLLQELGEQTIKPEGLTELIKKIIENTTKEGFRPIIRDIVEIYQTGGKEMNPELFLFFKDLFIEKGELHDYDRAAHNILLPVIDNKKCAEFIADNKDYFARVVNEHYEDSVEFIKKVGTLYDEYADINGFQEYANEIGAKPEIKEDEETKNEKTE